jgi:hypothetical protein
VYSLKQLVISGRKRRWILMDLETSLPLLYPLRYHIDHLAFRSLSTQSASLQSVKFFYEFWRQKYGVSFCYSFYSSDHNPDIAVGEMPAFWMYLENGHNVQSNVLSLTRVTKANSLTHTVRVRAVIHFISFLINTYISTAYRGVMLMLQRPCACSENLILPCLRRYPSSVLRIHRWPRSYTRN